MRTPVKRPVRYTAPYRTDTVDNVMQDSVTTLSRLPAGTTSWVGTVAQNPLSIVAVTTGPTGVVSGSIMLKGETHNIEYRVGDTYSVYKVRTTGFA